MILPPIIQRPPDWLTTFFTKFDPEDAEMDPFYQAHPLNFERLCGLVDLLKSKPRRVGCFAGAGISAAYRVPTWQAFLERAAETLGVAERVAPSLAAGRFEDAAQALEDHDASGFEAVIRETFSHRHIAPELRGVGGYLPFLPFDYVVTTNFDFVLDRIYQMGGVDLRPIIYGATLGFARSAADDQLLPLLKIHGDYLYDRILTRSQYDRYYADDAPLSRHLVELFSDVSFVFAGFSLQDEKVRQALRRAREDRPVPHYAILYADDASTAARRDAEFTELGVLPLWYTGDHAMAERLLGVVTAECRPDLFHAACALRVEDGAGALDIFRRLVAERPQCHAYRIAYAWSLAESIDWKRCTLDRDYVDRAVALVDRACEVVQGFGDAYTVRTVLSYMRFNFRDVVDDATTALELGCTSPETMRMMRGLCRTLFTRDLDGAVADLDALLAEPLIIDGQDLSGHVRGLRAMAGLMRAEPDAAVRLFEAFSDPTVNPDARRLSSRAGLLLFRAGSALYAFRWMRATTAWMIRKTQWMVGLMVLGARAGLVHAWMRRDERKEEKRRASRAR